MPIPAPQPSGAPAPAGPRRRLPPEERRTLLLETAIELFATRPAAEVSMSDVAREAGVSKALAFRYFENKRALFVEAVTAILERMEEASDPDATLPAEARFRDGLDQHLAVTERYPHALRSFLAGDLGRDPEVQSLVRAMEERLVDRIVGRLGVPEPDARLRHAVRSWLHFVLASNMDWLERRDVSRDTLIATQMLTFRAAVAGALGLRLEVVPAGDATPPDLP